MPTRDSMMRLARSILRRLTGPLGRRSLALLFVAGLWAWWLWGPVTPQSSWATRPPPEGYDLSSHLTGGGRFAVYWASKIPAHATGFVIDERLGPISIRDLATGRERLSLFADDLKALI